jgi:hypothetical protein
MSASPICTLPLTRNRGSASEEGKKRGVGTPVAKDSAQRPTQAAGGVRKVLSPVIDSRRTQNVETDLDCSTRCLRQMIGVSAETSVIRPTNSQASLCPNR